MANDQSVCNICFVRPWIYLDVPKKHHMQRCIQNSAKYYSKAADYFRQKDPSQMLKGVQNLPSLSCKHSCFQGSTKTIPKYWYPLYHLIVDLEFAITWRIHGSVSDGSICVPLMGRIRGDFMESKCLLKLALLFNKISSFSSSQVQI